MNSTAYKCSLCRTFQSITVRRLLNHIYSVHSKEEHFNISCPFDSCNAPAYKLYNSFYKHILKRHGEVYTSSTISMSLREEDQDTQPIVPDGDNNVLDDHNSNFSDRGSIYEVDGERNSDDEVLCEDENDDYDEDVTKVIEIKKSAARYLLSIKERNNLTQATIDSIINGTRLLINDVMLSIQSNLNNQLSIYNDTCVRIVEEVFHKLWDPFNGLETEPLQRAYFNKHFDLVDFIEVNLGTKLLNRKYGSQNMLHEKKENFIYIPLIDSIKQLLSNKKIRSKILVKNVTSRDGVYYDYFDGLLFKNDEYFIQHENVLGLILYHDEVEICNPLGSKSSKHKLDMYYYSIANLDPRYRSKHSAIRLLAIVNAKLVSKYGIMKVLQPIVHDLQKLYHGVKIEYETEIIEIYGKVISCTGDTLGQHAWGGFKEGVGGSHQKCRTCYCTFQNMQSKFQECDFQQRSIESYERDCTSIENATNTNDANIRKKLYGINCRSILTQLQNFDVSKQMPQDIMHTILEGVLQYELRLVILYYLKNGMFTFSQLNSVIENHIYGYSEISDKPRLLKESVFNGPESYKLKYNAAQARIFLRLIPFFFYKLFDCCGDHFNFVIELHKITQICFSPVLNNEILKELSTLITNHLKNFKNLFPNKNIIPKQHYLIHFPSTIKYLGPLIRYSCFSFEAAHKYFKKAAQRQNFKNITLSLARRYQKLECLNFYDGSFGGNSHPIFGTERKYGVFSMLSKDRCQSLRASFNEYGLLPEVSLDNMYVVSWVIVHGTKFKKGGFILIDCHNHLPEFAEITTIYKIEDFIYFEVKLYDTSSFEETFQAFKVIKSEPEKIHHVAYENIIDYNVYHTNFIEDKGLFIMTKYDLSSLLIEHLNGTNPLKSQQL